MERVVLAMTLAWFAAFVTMLAYGLLGCLGYNGCWTTFGVLGIIVFLTGYGVVLPAIVIESRHSSPVLTNQPEGEQ